MNSEFQQLAQKVDQLAQLAKTMRAENTELRLKVAELTSENSIMATRIQQAHDRVTDILEKLPLAEQESE
jgi:outer membrane murein-binding lipoprotein Lpp